MINLGNKIRELRKKKGITQEQLANALNLSPQAISKWEMGAGYPDVATLPVLAGYFGVSLDAMFDYDPEKLEEKIQQAILDARNVPFEKAEKILLEAISAYPGSEKLKKDLLSRYEMQMRYHGCPELKDAAIALAKKLIEAYEIDEPTAKKDVAVFLNKLREAGLLDE